MGREVLEDNIADGYKAEKVVYLFLHVRGVKQMYVGSAWNGLQVRTAKHLADAHHLGLLPSAPAVNRMRRACAYQLYIFFIKHGLKDVVVVPIEYSAPEHHTEAVVGEGTTVDG